MGNGAKIIGAIKDRRYIFYTIKMSFLCACYNMIIKPETVQIHDVGPDGCLVEVYK